MRLQRSTNWSVPSKVLQMLMPLSLLILTSCGGTITLPFGPIAPAQPTSAAANPQTPPIPLACFDFPPLPWSVGKTDPQTHLANTTVSDLLKVLALPSEQNPLGQARAMLGDTLTTRFELDDYRGRRVQLGCTDAASPH